jgi:hypothetical protein
MTAAHLHVRSGPARLGAAGRWVRTDQGYQRRAVGAVEDHGFDGFQLMQDQSDLVRQQVERYPSGLSRLPLR